MIGKKKITIEMQDTTVCDGKRQKKLQRGQWSLGKVV